MLPIPSPPSARTPVSWQAQITEAACPKRTTVLNEREVRCRFLGVQGTVLSTRKSLGQCLGAPFSGHLVPGYLPVGEGRAQVHTFAP